MKPLKRLRRLQYEQKRLKQRSNSSKNQSHLATEPSLVEATTILSTSLTISFNEQFSVLVFACLCSYYSVQDIHAKGNKLDREKLLFLTKPFPQLGNGQITLGIGSVGGE